MGVDLDEGCFADQAIGITVVPRILLQALAQELEAAVACEQAEVEALRVRVCACNLTPRLIASVQVCSGRGSQGCMSCSP